MAKKRRLTEEELDRIRPLEKRLRAAARRGDLDSAKVLVADLQPILRKAGDETRLQKAKAWLYEAALEAGDVRFARQGFIGIRAKMSERTRIYLEATALLAVCDLRRGRIEDAEPLMAEALERVGNIRSQARKRQFYRRLVDRFEEEWALSVLEGDEQEPLEPEKVQDQAGILVATEPEEEIYRLLGEYLPKYKVDQILRVYEFSHRQLPSAERLLLPSPEQKRKRKEVGGTVFRAARRAVWKGLCDPNSDTYRIWFEQGIMVAVDKKVIGAAVVAAMAGIGLGVYALAVPVTALIIKLGVDVFCETYSPDGLMIGLDE